MTNRQRKILKYISKHQKYIDVLKKFGFTLETYQDLNEIIGKYVVTSDSHYNESTIIQLNEHALEIIEDYKRINIRYWIPIIINSILSVVAIIISIIALCS